MVVEHNRNLDNGECADLSFHRKNGTTVGYDCIQRHSLRSNGTLFHFHLADALIQSDLQEQLGLSALLKGTWTDFSPLQFEPATFDYWPIPFIVLYKCTLKGKGYHLGRMPRQRNPLRGDTRSVITHPGRLQGPRGHSGLSYRDRHSDGCALFNESQTEGGLDTDSSPQGSWGKTFPVLQMELP
jgi:hypothetical protein